MLSIQNSTKVTHPDEVARLLPNAPALSAPLWWTEALVPWTDAAEVGTSILHELGPPNGRRPRAGDAS